MASKNYTFTKTLNLELSAKENMCRLNVKSNKFNTNLKIADIKAINELTRKQLTNAKDKYTFVIHGIFGAKTLKSYANDNLDFGYIEDYIEGLVKDTGKFTECYFVEILYHKFK